ncbi:MAG: DUF1838 family protein [Rhodospirillaceae bacterium]|nr:DUF1838 family protein [Rhodospirillaceae bacterium]
MEINAGPSRRTALAGFSVATSGLATAAAAPARAATGTALDLSPGWGNLNGFLKTRSDIGGAPSVTYAYGTVVTKIPGRKARVLTQTHAVNVTRCLKDATGYQFLQRECVIFCDAASGAPLKTWLNPFIDREVRRFWQVVPKEMLARLEVPVRLEAPVGAEAKRA